MQPGLRGGAGGLDADGAVVVEVADDAAAAARGAGVFGLRLAGQVALLLQRDAELHGAGGTLRRALVPAAGTAVQHFVAHFGKLAVHVLRQPERRAVQAARAELRQAARHVAVGRHLRHVHDGPHAIQPLVERRVHDHELHVRRAGRIDRAAVLAVGQHEVGLGRGRGRLPLPCRVLALDRLHGAVALHRRPRLAHAAVQLAEAERGGRGGGAGRGAAGRGGQRHQPEGAAPAGPQRATASPVGDQRDRPPGRAWAAGGHARGVLGGRLGGGEIARTAAPRERTPSPGSVAAFEPSATSRMIDFSSRLLATSSTGRRPAARHYTRPAAPRRGQRWRPRHFKVYCNRNVAPRYSSGVPSSSAEGPAMLEAVRDLQSQMESQGYITDQAIATTVYLAMALHKPVLIEGQAGVGKTEVAKVLSAMLETDLIRLQCYEGLDANTALYEWNY